MSVIYYDGDRICFRPIELEDEALLRKWVNDPRVWSTLGFRQPINAVREREWIESFGQSADDYVFGVVVKAEERLIGTCGLHRINWPARCATYGLMIGDVDSHGRGYGTEATLLALRFAFEELNLHRVELCVYDHNTAGIRVYEKAGFELEGRLRQRMWRHGAWHDELRYAVLREEWRGGARREVA